MIDTANMIKLAMLKPYGMSVNDRQIHYRSEIEKQQHELAKIHQRTASKKNRSTSLADISKMVKRFGIDRVGVSRILPSTVFDGNHVSSNETCAIVLVFPLQFDQMLDTPSESSATEIMKSYYQTGLAVLHLTKYLKSRGHSATGHHPMGDVSQHHAFLFPPYAVEAGLGEKGRTGLYIDNTLGPTVRLGLVTTSLKLSYGSPVSKGINAFCHRCRYCVPYCPPRALPSDKYLNSLRSGKKINFQIDSEKCFKYFEKHYSCGNCFVKCVLNQPTRLEITKRMKRIEIWNDKWVKSGELEKLHETIST